MGQTSWKDNAWIGENMIFVNEWDGPEGKTNSDEDDDDDNDNVDDVDDVDGNDQSTCEEISIQTKRIIVNTQWFSSCPDRNISNFSEYQFWKTNLIYSRQTNSHYRRRLLLWCMSYKVYNKHILMLWAFEHEYKYIYINTHIQLRLVKKKIYGLE